MNKFCDSDATCLISRIRIEIFPLIQDFSFSRDYVALSLIQFLTAVSEDYKRVIVYWEKAVLMNVDVSSLVEPVFVNLQSLTLNIYGHIESVNENLTPLLTFFSSLSRLTLFSFARTSDILQIVSKIETLQFLEIITVNSLPMLECLEIFIPFH
jgi:hypothetical protein